MRIKFFLLSLLGTALPGLAYTDYDIEEDYVRYSVLDRDERTCMTVAHAMGNVGVWGVPKQEWWGLQEDIDIPPMVTLGDGGEYTVTEIGPGSFKNWPYIRTLTVPGTVTRIGKKAFLESHCLYELDLPESVVEIDDYAFCKCDYNVVQRPDLKPEWTPRPTSLPNSIRRIGAEAFSRDRNHAITNIPTSVTEIGRRAFYGVRMPRLVLPPSLETVGKEAFVLSGLDPRYESIRIYSTFRKFRNAIKSWVCEDAIYYLVSEPQGNDGQDILFFDPTDKNLKRDVCGTVPLYVLQEGYDRIMEERLEPWVSFADIRIYDPKDDPYFLSVDEVGADPGLSVPEGVYTLHGVRVADTTDGLMPGIYIVREGPVARKTVVR